MRIRQRTTHNNDPRNDSNGINKHNITVKTTTKNNGMTNNDTTIGTTIEVVELNRITNNTRL